MPMCQLSLSIPLLKIDYHTMTVAGDALGCHKYFVLMLYIYIASM